MMILIDHARAQVLAQVQALPGQAVPLAEAVGRVLAHAVQAPAALPAFDNAAMDGYALPLAGQAITAGAQFELDDEQAAGDAARTLDRACAIMTGAVLPRGLDAVVPVEDVTVLETGSDGLPRRIRIEADVRCGQHIRRAGEDVRAGSTVLPSGRALTPADAMVLAALGVADVTVRRRPRVAVFCTGRELVDDPAQILGSGQIRNSNGPFLRARLLLAGAELVQMRTLADAPDAWRAALADAEAAGVDLVVSTGAVSMGRYDFVPEALQAAGAERLFHRVAMRPGKPVLCARLRSAALYFGLPGNPASTAVGQRFFVETALRGMLGMAPERALSLPLQHAVAKKPGLTLFQKARVELGAGAGLQVALLAGQESFKIVPLVQANAWAELPASEESLGAGTRIPVHTLGHLEPGIPVLDSRE